MSVNELAPWHKESWDQFTQEGLPTLLSERLPLVGYRVESSTDYTCTMTVVLSGKDGEVEVVYHQVPQPDEAGLFKMDGCYKVVIPMPTSVDLAEADILCVGEQLLNFLTERLGEAPENVSWDESMAREWLPLDGWVREFLLDEDTSQFLQRTNWLDVYTHIRRITLFPLLGEAKGVEHAYSASEQGRVCPFCTPEGPNIARILEIAQGAVIRDGKLIILDHTPEKNLGMGAASIPFLEHNDTNRLLMGVNMMRQWVNDPGPDLPQDDVGLWQDYYNRFQGGSGPEPALVQTGNEPDDPYFWQGYNVLTAYMSWDGDGFEDAIVISESCANRMAHPERVEVGDKLSNRYGSKGVVGRILPDSDMPHLKDGSAVELIFSLSNLPSRMNFGQIREAVMGRIAKAEGQAAVVPAFATPDQDALQERLRKNGLPESGMEVLSVNGQEMERPSTVGWVYWGRTSHLAREKIHLAVSPSDSCQRLGEAEYLVLRETGASETIRALFNTQSANRADAETLVDRVASGQIEPADSPSPGFTRLAGRLEAAGIQASLQDEGVLIDRSEASGLTLATSVNHPWYPAQALKFVGEIANGPEYDDLEEANSRLSRMLSTGAPKALVDKATEQLENRVKAYFDGLVQPEDLHFQERILFSARSVIAPGYSLHFDQVGLPEEIAWALFGPIAARAAGAAAVEKRNQKALEALGKAVADMWVIVYRAPAYSRCPFIAFKPVICSGNAILLPNMACSLMNANFDGDQVAVLLPLTDGGQKEAEERLSLAGHMTHIPDLLEAILPKHDALFGLASLCRTDPDQIQSLTGREYQGRPGTYLDKKFLETAVRPIFDEEGAQAALEASERWMRRGYDVARLLGASMNPFLGGSYNLPPRPESDDPEQWRAYADEVAGWLDENRDESDNDLGPILMLNNCGARANMDQLRQFGVEQAWFEALTES